MWGNLWRGREVWGEGHITSTEKQRIIIKNKHQHFELTYEDRLDSINEFFDSLFESIDYSLLLIFLGLFVVVANLESTGIPKQLWYEKLINHIVSALFISIFQYIHLLQFFLGIKLSVTSLLIR